MPDLASLDRRLSNVEYINAHVDITYYGELITAIRSLASFQGRTVEEPDINLPHAWSRAYRIYQALLREQQSPRTPEAIEATKFAHEGATTELYWNDYLVKRSALLEYIRLGLSYDEREYVGLLKGDLAEAMVGGVRREGWRMVADRLGRAARQVENMSREERLSIPHVLAARRAKAANDALEERLSQIEIRISQLEEARTLETKAA